MAFVSLAVLWLPSCGTETGDFVLASSETAGSGFQSWWGGVAGGVSPGRASESFQEQVRVKQRGQLTATRLAGHPLPSSPPALGSPPGSPSPRTAPGRARAAPPPRSWPSPATLASSEACRPSGGFLSGCVSDLRRGRELCHRQPPKPTRGPQAGGSQKLLHRVAWTGGTQRMQKSCKDGACTSQFPCIYFLCSAPAVPPAQQGATAQPS